MRGERPVRFSKLYANVDSLRRRSRDVGAKFGRRDVKLEAARFRDFSGGEPFFYRRVATRRRDAAELDDVNHGPIIIYGAQ